MRFLLCTVLQIFLFATAMAQPSASEVKAAADRGQEYALDLNKKIAGKSEAEANKMIADAIDEKMQTDPIGGAYILIKVKGTANQVVAISKMVQPENRQVITTLSKYIVAKSTAENNRQTIPSFPASLPSPNLKKVIDPNKKYVETSELSAEAKKILNEGFAAYKAKNYPLAISKYTVVINLEPRYADGYSSIATALLNSGKYKEGIEQIDKYLALRPPTAALFYNKGFGYAKLENYENAIAFYNKALALSPNEGSYYAARSISYCKQGEVQKANADKDLANAKGYKFTTVCTIGRSEEGAVDFKKALALQEDGKYAEAIKIYTELIAKDANYDVAIENRGLCYLNARDQKLALADLNKAIAIKGDKASYYYNRGLFYETYEDSAKAIIDYKKSIDLDGDYLLPHKRVGGISFKKRDYKEAIKYYSVAQKLEPDDAGLMVDLGASYYNSNDQENAEKFYKLAVDREPTLLIAQQNLGSLYLAQKKYDDAIKYYSNALQLDSKFADNYLQRGIAYHNSNQYEKAISDYEACIKLEPTKTYAYSNIGNIKYSQKEDSVALIYYGKSLKIDPENITALFYSAKSLNRQKKFDEAIPFLSKVIVVDPSYINAYYDLGFTFGNLGKYEEALKNITLYIAKDQTNYGAYYNHGYYSYRLNKYDEAISSLTKSITLNPKYGNAYEYRAKSYCAKGLKSLAKSDEDKAIELGEKIASRCQ